MSTRAKLIVALIVVVGILGVLIQTAVTKAATFYMTVSELNSEGAQAVGQAATVSGVIIGSSVVWNPDAHTLRFAVADSTGGKPLPVSFRGDKPDDFNNGWPVVVFGSLNADGTFYANKLLIKCPSKYSAQPKTYQAST